MLRQRPQDQLRNLTAGGHPVQKQRRQRQPPGPYLSAAEIRRAAENRLDLPNHVTTPLESSFSGMRKFMHRLQKFRGHRRTSIIADIFPKIRKPEQQTAARRTRAGRLFDLID